jgi:GAG-pre-integrase domain
MIQMFSKSFVAVMCADIPPVITGTHVSQENKSDQRLYVRKCRKSRIRASKRLYRLREIPWVSGRGMQISQYVKYALSRKNKMSSDQRDACRVDPTHSDTESLTEDEDQIAFQSTEENEPIVRKYRFDTDSYPIRVDNCCTCCISPSLSDFVGPVVKVRKRSVKGFSGHTSVVQHRGTVLWTISDDAGVPHEIRIPNSYHVPDAPCRLLSPQHWSQQMKDPYGTWCATFGTEIVLQWNHRQHTRTIKLDPASNNVATMWSSPSYSKYADHEHDVQFKLVGPTCYSSDVVVTDDEMEDEDEEEPSDMHEGADESYGSNTIRPEGVTTHFDLNAGGSRPLEPAMVEDDNLDLSMDDSAKMLKWHHRLGHIPMRRIQIMAERGQLPKQLAKCRVPMCQACIYGKLMRKRWRSKGVLNAEKLRTITAPGQCVSVDQLESTIPGLVGQLKGKLTLARYKAATVFVDHFSDLVFVHVQQSTSAKETIEAKAAFEQYARTCGVLIKHYHADNGRFAENLWRADVLEKGQRLTFCGVSAHHQNGRAEKKIRDVQDLAR